MQRIFLNSIFAATVFGIAVYIAWLEVKRPLPNCPKTSIVDFCALLQTGPCDSNNLSMWIRVSTTCPYCTALIKELSQIDFDGQIHLVSSESFARLSKWSLPHLSNQRYAIHANVSNPVINKLFCSSKTPVVMVYTKQQLKVRHEGYQPLKLFLLQYDLI